MYLLEEYVRYPVFNIYIKKNHDVRESFRLCGAPEENILGFPLGHNCLVTQGEWLVELSTSCVKGGLDSALRPSWLCPSGTL